jgi:hypothetical protein
MHEITSGRQTEVFRTEDAWLAAALITLGCKPFVADNQGAILRTVSPDGRENCNFLFESSEQVKNLSRLWLDMERTQIEQPENPLCYLWALMHNRNRCIDAVKQTRRLVFRRHPTNPKAMVFATEKITQ